MRFSVPVRAACLALPPVGGLAGCGVVHIFDPTVRQRGSRVDPDALKELIPGTSTRADVAGPHRLAHGEGHIRRQYLDLYQPTHQHPHRPHTRRAGRKPW